MRAPLFFSALHALAVDDGGGGRRISPCRLAHLDVERMVDARQSAVALPLDEIVVMRALRRQIGRHRTPLAARAEHVEKAIDDLALIGNREAASLARRRQQRLQNRPFAVGHIGRIALGLALVLCSRLWCPHALFPAEPTHARAHGITTESQDSSLFRTGSEP